MKCRVIGLGKYMAKKGIGLGLVALNDAEIVINGPKHGKLTPMNFHTTHFSFSFFSIEFLEILFCSRQKEIKPGSSRLLKLPMLVAIFSRSSISIFCIQILFLLYGMI